MVQKRLKNSAEECQQCERGTRYLAEFNNLSLCARCFDKAISEFVEDRRLKIRVAIA
jgi:hypothetical protein